jgi:hypothetical protein
MSKRPITPLAMAVPAAKGSAYVAEDLEVEAPTSPDAQAPKPAPALPKGPAGMNFKLPSDASAALRMHQFRTGRTKQAIVEEALNQWLERNHHLIE